MNITEEIEKLEEEYDTQAAAKIAAHNRMMEISVQIRKLRTVLKKAEQVFSTDKGKT